MPPIIAKSSYDYRFKLEGERVLVFRDGELVCDWPYNFVLEQALPALRQQALRAQEQAEAQRIAHDSAILLRAGARMVLSDRADIQAEAKKLAAHDRNLRRFMPHVKSQEAFGHPTFEHVQPKSARNQ